MEKEITRLKASQSNTLPSPYDTPAVPTTGMGPRTESEELTDKLLISVRPLEAQSRTTNHRTDYGTFVTFGISKFSHLVSVISFL